MIDYKKSGLLFNVADVVTAIELIHGSCNCALYALLLVTLGSWLNEE